jgi:uncharacterized FlgJ-related protein
MIHISNKEKKSSLMKYMIRHVLKKIKKKESIRQERRTLIDRKAKKNQPVVENTYSMNKLQTHFKSHSSQFILRFGISLI